MIWVSPLRLKVRKRLKKTLKELSHILQWQIRGTRRKSLARFWGSNLSQSISYAGFCHPSSSGFFPFVYRKWALLELGLWAVEWLHCYSQMCFVVSLLHDKIQQGQLAAASLALYSPEEIVQLRYSHSYNHTDFHLI